jgi:hypothetical protein
VNIGSGLTQIGVDAFRELSRLLSFTVDSNNKSYMAEEGILFNKTKTELIKCPVTKTGVYTVPSTVTSIADYAFVYCYHLNSVVIGANVTQIGRGVFSNCNRLTSLIVDSENEHYMSDDGVLLNKAKTTLVRYPEGKSGEYVIPHTVTRIEYLAIAGCQNLTAVAIPSSVTFIEGYAVYNCENLTNVTVGWTTPPAISYNFSGVPLNAATLHVPAGTKATYEAANVWKEFGNIVEY